MSKHTPGPWRIKWGENIFGGERLVANAGSHQQNFDTEKAAAENKANARLIAAAPDLLEALKAVVTEDGKGWTNLTVGSDSTLAAAVAAIAKAEGKA